MGALGRFDPPPDSAQCLKDHSLGRNGSLDLMPVPGNSMCCRVAKKKRKKKKKYVIKDLLSTVMCSVSARCSELDRVPVSPAPFLEWRHGQACRLLSYRAP